MGGITKDGVRYLFVHPYSSLETVFSAQHCLGRNLFHFNRKKIGYLA